MKYTLVRLFPFLIALCGGCAQPIAPGNQSTLGPAGATSTNQPPQTVGEATDAAGNRTKTAAGAAAVASVEQSPTTIKQTSSGGAESRLVLQLSPDKSLSFATAKDYELASVEVDPDTGAVRVKGFKASASEPTKAIAVPLEKVVEIIKTWTPAQQQAFSDYVKGEEAKLKAIASPFAGILSGIAAAAGLP